MGVLATVAIVQCFVVVADFCLFIVIIRDPYVVVQAARRRVATPPEVPFAKFQGLLVHFPRVASPTGILGIGEINPPPQQVGIRQHRVGHKALPRLDALGELAQEGVCPLIANPLVFILVVGIYQLLTKG